MAVAVFTMAGLFAATAQAEVWNGGGGANDAWSNTANWDLGDIPGPTDNWQFVRPGTYTVDLEGANVTFNNISMNQNTNTHVNFDIYSSSGAPTMFFDTLFLKKVTPTFNVALDGVAIHTDRKNGNTTFNKHVTLSGLAEGPGEQLHWIFNDGAALNGGLDVKWFNIFIGDNAPHVDFHNQAATVGGPGVTVGDHGRVTIFNDGASLATNNLTFTPPVNAVNGDGYLDNQSNIPVTVSDTLSGFGTPWKGAIELLGTGTVAPGASVGILAGDASNSSLIFDAGASYDWEIADADGTTPGTDWDLLSATDISFAGNWTLNILDSGMVGTVDPDEPFVIAQSSNGFTGFNVGNVTVVGGPGWENAAVSIDGNDLVLAVGSALAVPEPSSLAIWTLGLLGLAWRARRRRTK
jgi:hypothetical protein